MSLPWAELEELQKHPLFYKSSVENPDFEPWPVEAYPLADSVCFPGMQSIQPEASGIFSNRVGRGT